MADERSPSNKKNKKSARSYIEVNPTIKADKDLKETFAGLSESVIAALMRKADDYGVDYDVVADLYFEGMGQWNPDSGKTRSQFGFERVNAMITELSRGKLSRYIKRAVGEIEARSAMDAYGRMRQDYTSSDKDDAKRHIRNRKWGVHKAADRLAKEDVSEAHTNTLLEGTRYAHVIYSKGAMGSKQFKRATHEIKNWGKGPDYPEYARARINDHPEHKKMKSGGWNREHVTVTKEPHSHEVDAEFERKKKNDKEIGNMFKKEDMNEANSLVGAEKKREFHRQQGSKHRTIGINAEKRASVFMGTPKEKIFNKISDRHNRKADLHYRAAEAASNVISKHLGESHRDRIISRVRKYFTEGKEEAIDRRLRTESEYDHTTRRIWDKHIHNPGGDGHKNKMVDSSEAARAHRRGFNSGFSKSLVDDTGIKREHIHHFNKGYDLGKKAREEHEKTGSVVPHPTIVKNRYGEKKPNPAFKKLADEHYKKLKEEIELEEARRGRPRKDGKPVGGGEEDDSDQHIVMQLRKVVTLRGQKPVTFRDGKSKHIAPHVAAAALHAHSALRRADHKQDFEKRLHASHKSFVSALQREALEEMFDRDQEED